MRNSKKHIVFVFILFFAIILSNITIVSSEEQEYDGIYYQTDDEEITYKTLSDFDFTKKIPMPAIIEIKIIEGISEKTPDWVHEIKAHINDIIKFRITIENTLNYNMIDVNFVNTLPSDSVLKLLENTITHDESVSIEVQNGEISGSVNDLRMGEQAVIEYCMEALVETEINGVTSIITTEALLNPTYEKELKTIEETIFLKKDVLHALIIEIDNYEEKIIILDEGIEQSKLEEQIITEKIVLYDAALNALLSEKNLVEEKIRVDGENLGLLIEKEEGLKRDLDDIVFAISNKDAFIALKEAELIEQGNTLEIYTEGLLNLKERFEIASDEKEANDVIIADFNNKIDAKEKELAATLTLVDQLKDEIFNLEKDADGLNDKKVIIVKDIELIIEEITKSTDDLNILRTQEEVLSADIDKTFAEIDVEKEKAEALAVKILETNSIIANLDKDVLLFEDERKILQRDIDATILLINEKNDKINLFSTQSESLELEINDLTNLRNLKTIELGDAQKLILETQNLLDDKNIYLADMQADLVKKEANLLILNDDFDDKTFEQTILNTDIANLKNYIAATENTIKALAQQESLLIQEKGLILEKIDESIILQNKLLGEIGLTSMKIDLALQDLNAFKAESNKIAGEILVLEGEIANAEANLANVKAEIIATTGVYEQNDVVLNALKVNYNNYQSILTNLKYDLEQKTLEQTATDAGVIALKESIASAENTLAALKLEETSLTLDTNNLAEEARQLETLYAEITRDIELTQLKIDSKLQDKLTLDISHSDLKDDLTLTQQDSEEYTSLIGDIDVDILAATETISAKQEAVASLNDVIYEKEVNLESDVEALNYIQNQLDDENQQLTLFKERYDSRSSQPLVSDELYALELQIDEQTAVVNNLIYDKALKEQSIKTALLGLESDHNTNHFLLDEIAILEAKLSEKQEDKKVYEQRRIETIALFDSINTNIADTETKILNVTRETEELITEKAGYEQASADTKVLITETQNLIVANTISLSNVGLSIQNEEAELSDLNKYLLVKIQANSATDEEVNAIILDIQETEGEIAEVNSDIKTAEATASTLTEKTLDLKSRQTALSNDILAKEDVTLLKIEAYDILDVKIKDASEKIDYILIPQKIDHENQLIQVDNTLTAEKLELDEKIKAIAAIQGSIIVEEDKLTALKQELNAEIQADVLNNEEINQIIFNIQQAEEVITKTKLDIQTTTAGINILSDTYDSSKLNEKILSDTIGSTDAEILLLNTENLQVKSNIENLGGVVSGLIDSKTLNEDNLLAIDLKINGAKQAILLAESNRGDFIAQKTQADSNTLALEGAKDDLISEKTLISASIYDTGLLIKKLNDDKLAKENEGLLIDDQIADKIQLIDDKTEDVNTYLGSSEAIKFDLLVLNANLLDSTEKSDALQMAITGYITDIPAAEENLNKQTLLVENIIADLAMVRDESGELELLRDNKIQDIALAESDIIAKQNLIAENEQIYEGIILDVSSVEQEKTVSIQQLGDIKATLEEKTNTYNIFSDDLEQKEGEFYKTEEEVRVLKYKIDEEITELQNIQTFNPNIVTIYVDTNPFNVLPQIDINKKVYDEETVQWVDFLSVYNGNEVRFNITVLNVGDVIIPDITVTDVLPIDILAYIPDSSTPSEPAITKNILSWNFNSIAPGETIFIEFSSSCIKTGTNDNYAFAMGEYPIHEFNTAIAVKIISDNVTINVMEIPVNSPPEAVDDNVEVSEDSTDNILDVLSNDLDSDENDVLSIDSIQIQPENGNANIDQGMIIYNPNSNFYGQDSIIYRITDNNGSFDTGNVYITIININDNPVAVEDDANTPENTSVDIPVLDNDYDIDEDDLTIEGVDVEPEHGSLNINSDIITYTPILGYNGSDSFVYNISDGNNAYSTAIVNIDVYVVMINHPPVAKDDVKYVFKDSNINVIRALANDHDPDEGDSITLDTILVPPSNGSARILGEYIIYTPEEGFNGTDVLTYRIVDSYGENDTAIVTIHVRERSQKTISKPKEGGFLYLWGNELFNIEPLLDLLDCEALIIGPIDIHVNVSETSDIPIEYTKLYVAGDEKVNTTERNFNWTWDETVFGICTIKIVMYSEDTELIDEMDVLIFNLGNTSE